MKCKILFLVFYLFLMVPFTYAQENVSYQKTIKEKNYYPFKIGFEIGPQFMFNADLNDKWAVRQDVGSFGYGYDSYISTLFNGFTFSVKPEYTFAGGRFSVVSGLQYSYQSVKLEKDSYNPDYFYLRYDTEGANTNYARVHSIYESYHFIGIPVEVSWIPLRFNGASFYLTLGGDIRFKLNSNVAIDFVNESMTSLEQEICNEIGVETSNILSSIYILIGMNIRFTDKINGKIEVFLPSTYLTENNFSLVDPQNYSGFRFTLQIPVGKQ